jgi:hypothetical protein
VRAAPATPPEPAAAARAAAWLHDLVRRGERAEGGGPPGGRHRNAD